MRRLYSSALYRHLPVVAQNAIVIAKGIAYRRVKRGHQFREISAQLLNNERLDADGVGALQFNRLKQVLEHCYIHVPYYRRLFDGAGVRPTMLNSVRDLEKLPFLTKELVRGHGQELLADNVAPRRVLKGSTSGSSGTPLTLHMTRTLVQGEQAFVERQYRWAGLPPGGRVAVFRGDLIVPVSNLAPPYWRYDAVGRELWFSSYHLSPNTVADYLRRLRRFDPHLIYCYPSSLAALATFARQAGTLPSLASLRGIVTSSETLYPNQQVDIESVFGCPVFDWYGHFERAIFIATCSLGNHHVCADYGFTEFIPAGEGDAGPLYELVGTGFFNYAMPLVWYRTGDLVTLTKEQCGCGLAFQRVGTILGRADDYLETPDGRLVGRLDHVFKDARHVVLAQIVQHARDQVTVRVVPTGGYGQDDVDHIRAALRLYLGDRTQVSVEAVEDIPRLPNGKFKTVISHVKHSGRT